MRGNPNPSPATRFQPGVSGNPGGRPKALMTKEQVELTLQSMALMTPTQLQAVLNDPNSNIIQLAAARTWQNVARTGDMSEVNRILDRAVGKIVETYVNENHNTTHSDLLDAVPTEDLLKLVANDKK